MFLSHQAAREVSILWMKVTLPELSFTSSQWVLESGGGLVKNLSVWGDIFQQVNVGSNQPYKPSLQRLLVLLTVAETSATGQGFEVCGDSGQKSREDCARKVHFKFHTQFGASRNRVMRNCLCCFFS